MAAARAHEREHLGFDLEALVREYDALRTDILDAADAEPLTLASREVRVLGDVIGLAIAEGAKATSSLAARWPRCFRA